MKKLTSERLGREALAAWEDRKPDNEEDDVDNDKQIIPQGGNDLENDPEEVDSEKVEVAQAQPVNDEESQVERGSWTDNTSSKRN